MEVKMHPESDCSAAVSGELFAFLFGSTVLYQIFLKATYYTGNLT